jgi:hypothetical protein
MPYRRPVDDIESLFGHEQARARKESSAEESQRLQHMEEIAAESEVRKKVDDRERWRLANLVQVNETYLARGLEPPEWTDQRPPISLDLLLKLGWRVETISGKPVLIKPRPPEPFDGFTDNDSLPRTATRKRK